MDIRILQPGDEDLLVRGVDLSDEGPITRDRATAHLADVDLVNVVAIEDDQVVGFTYGHVLRRFEATSFLIYSIDTDPAWRRRGIARAMIEALKALGDTGRWNEMFVLTNAGNTAAMALYASLGGVQPDPADVVMFDFYD